MRPGRCGAPSPQPWRPPCLPHRCPSRHLLPCSQRVCHPIKWTPHGKSSTRRSPEAMRPNFPVAEVPVPPSQSPSLLLSPPTFDVRTRSGVALLPRGGFAVGVWLSLPGSCPRTGNRVPWDVVVTRFHTQEEPACHATSYIHIGKRALVKGATFRTNGAHGRHVASFRAGHLKTSRWLKRLSPVNSTLRLGKSRGVLGKVSVHFGLSLS